MDTTIFIEADVTSFYFFMLAGCLAVVKNTITTYCLQCSVNPYIVHSQPLVRYVNNWLVVTLVERCSSEVELRTLNYENPGSNPVLLC